MAPSPPVVLTYAFKIVKDSEYQFTWGVLNATISLRQGDSSLILISDDAELVPSLAQLRTEAEAEGVPVVTTENADSLKTAFGLEAATVVSYNGGKDHRKYVVEQINEAIAIANSSPAA